jgi:hypothetical protein
MLANPMTLILAISQRVRVTLCVNTKRWVPVSNSRATSGAPQKIPMMPGATITKYPSHERNVRLL